MDKELKHPEDTHHEAPSATHWCSNVVEGLCLPSNWVPRYQSSGEKESSSSGILATSCSWADLMANQCNQHWQATKFFLFPLEWGCRTTAGFWHILWMQLHCHPLSLKRRNCPQLLHLPALCTAPGMLHSTEKEERPQPLQPLLLAKKE